MSTEPEKNFGAALYHPNIHIKDPDWLKSALLYWDGIRRIVPENFPTDEDDPELKGPVRELVLERPRLLPRTYPTNYVDAAMKKFISCAAQFHQTQGPEPNQSGRGAVFGMLRDVYRRITGAKEVEHEGLKELLDTLLQASRGSAEVDMWNGKMSDRLRWVLEKEGLLRDDDETGYVWVQKAAADLYMICLATVMSENIQSPLITYKPEYADVGKYLDFGKPQKLDKDPRISLLMKLELPFPSPEELHELSLLEILDVHDKTEVERRAFRKAVEDLFKEASKAEGDEYRYEDFLKDQKEELKEKFQRHRDKMGSLQVKGFGSFLKISAPTGVSTIASAVATIGFLVNPFTTAIIAGTGAVLSGVAWWGEVRQQRRDAVENFPYHYLLTLEKELLVVE
jgi:hypothetical protein